MAARQRKPDEMDHVERRIRAAMWLAGLDFDQLAEKISLPKLGATTLRKLDATRATRLQLQPIADACDVPYEFFTEGASATGGIDRIEKLIEVLDGHMRRHALELHEGRANTAKEIKDQLTRIEACVRPLQDQVTGLQDAVVNLAADSLRQTRALEELADEDRRRGSGGDSP